MPQIGDFPVCTCNTSNICFIHKPSGGPLGSDKAFTGSCPTCGQESQPCKVFIVIDAYLDDEEEPVEIIHSVHRTLIGAQTEIQDLMVENLKIQGDPYDQVEDLAELQYNGFMEMWETAMRSYVAIQEKILQD